MLTEIRDRSSGWFSYVIAGLIIIPMAFWGVQEYASTEANPSVVEIGEQKITQADFQAQFSNQQQRMRQAMGENVDNDFLASESFKDRVLQDMINRALLEQVALDQGYRISDAQLAEMIRESEIFQIDGKFDEAAYEQYVLSSQFSRTRFENALREDRRLQQVTSGYEESALVLPDEIRELLEIQAEKRSFDVITVRQQDYIEGIEVSEDEIAAYYEDNQDAYLKPEKMSVEYLELTLDSISENIEVDEDELLVYYEDNVDSFISTERRDTRHILLSTNNNEDEDAQLAKAESLAEQLRGGADFAELAKEHSQDPGSAANGGSLGLIEPEQMVPEFDQAAFTLAQDEISAPIKSQFGYHIIQVVKIEEPVQQSFAEVKFDLMLEERERLAEETLLEQVEELREQTFVQPDTLNGAAEALEIPVLKSELFDRNSGEGVAASAQVRGIAFGGEVLEDDINSEPIEISPGQYVVIRKLDYQPSEPEQLADVSDLVRTALTQEKAADAAKQAGESLLEQARLNWQTLADNESLGVSSHAVALIDNNRVVSQTVLQKVSTMQLNGGLAAVDSAEDLGGDYHIIRLTGVEAGDVNTVSAQIKDSTRRIIAQRNGQSLINNYLLSLGDKLAPEINNDLL
ncbi:MAG: SurA N-terminal domain-containing protein [Pseudomonadota bacterium]